MGGSPQPQAGQQKPRLLCPVMSLGKEQAACFEHHCALWFAKYRCCGLVAHRETIEDGFSDLVKVAMDIRGKI